MRATYLAHLLLLDLVNDIWWGTACYESPHYAVFSNLLSHPLLSVLTFATPRSEHSPSQLQKNSRSALYRDVIATCFEIHTKYVDTLCTQNVESVNVKAGGTYRNHQALSDNNLLGLRSFCIFRVLYISVLFSSNYLCDWYHCSISNKELRAPIAFSHVILS